MQQGLLTNESVDRALFNSMRVRFEMGLFDPVSSVSAKERLYKRCEMPALLQAAN